MSLRDSSISRRGVVIATGLLLTGCVGQDPPERVTSEDRGTSNGGSADSSDTDVEPTVTETPVPEAPTTEEPEPEPADLVEIESHEWFEGKEFLEDDLAVRGIVRNISDVMLRAVELSVDFYDSDGVVVGEGTTYATYLPAGYGYQFNVGYYSRSEVPYSEVDTYELYFDVNESYAIEEDNIPGNDLVSIREHESTVVEGYGGTDTVVQGILENISGEDLHFASVDVRFIDANKVIIGRGSDIKEDLREGAKWKFAADYYSETNVPQENIDSYDISGEGTLYRD